MKRTISVILVLILCIGLLPGTALASTPFTDVPDNAYYTLAVEWAVGQGITSGTTATTFSPDMVCTRGQIVKFLWNYAGQPAPTSTENPFTDVKAGAYYYDAVLWAVENGITSGTSATTFSPDMVCTRGQIVTFLWNYAGKPVPTSTENPFTDVKAGAYYYNAVLWAVENGITSGTTATKFSPDMKCTRAQIVKFLHNYELKLFRVTVQPRDVITVPGQTVEFEVSVVGGTQPYSYQWQYTCDGMNDYADLSEDFGPWASDWTSDTLSIYVTQLEFIKNYQYRCKITDASGRELITEAAKAIDGSLRLEMQPKDTVVAVSEYAAFEVVAEGGELPYTYQWQYICDGESEYINFSDEETWAEDWTESLLRLCVTQEMFDENYQFRCVVTDANGDSVTSQSAKVAKPLTVTQHPQHVKGVVGETVTFTVAAAEGVGPYTYQWQMVHDLFTSGYKDLGSSDNWVSGWNTPTLQAEVYEADLTYHTYYRCKITDSTGAVVYSDGALVYDDMKITQQPQNVPAAVGAEVSFVVEADGGVVPYTYQWQVSSDRWEGWQDIDEIADWASGWKTTKLWVEVDIMDFQEHWQYRCKITDALGNVIYSDPAQAVPIGS